MRKNRIRSVIVHAPDSSHALTAKVNSFYIEVIERRLNKSNLTTEEKLLVIDRILAQRQSRG